MQIQAGFGRGRSFGQPSSQQGYPPARAPPRQEVQPFPEHHLQLSQRGLFTFRTDRHLALWCILQTAVAEYLFGM